jgi:hypothetical protein
VAERTQSLLLNFPNAGIEDSTFSTRRIQTCKRKALDNGRHFPYRRDSCHLLLLFVSSFYILVYYQHPDDRNDAYFPKVIVVLGFVMAGATVLGLPIDVVNNEGYAGT